MVKVFLIIFTTWTISITQRSKAQNGWDSVCIPQKVLLNVSGNIFQVGVAAKIYRFKEMILWRVDEDKDGRKGYYTDATRK